MKPKIDDYLISEVRAHLEELSPENRLEFISRCMEDWCQKCGGPRQNRYGQYCQCWNDE